MHGAWWGCHALYSVLLKMPPPLHGLSFGSAKAQIIFRSPCTYLQVTFTRRFHPFAPSLRQSRPCCMRAVNAGEKVDAHLL